MGGPIDYLPGLQPMNPLQAFGQAYGLGQSIGQPIQARQEAQAQAQAAAERQRQQQELTAKVFGGSGNAEDRANLLFMMAPEQAKIAQTAFDSMDKETRTQKALEAGKIAAAYQSGNAEVGQQLMEERIKAQRESGDEAGAQLNEKLLAADKINPGQVANYLKNTLALFPEGRDMLDSQLKVEVEPTDTALKEAQTAEIWSRIYEKDHPKPLTPEQVVTAEKDLRNEYNNRTANFQMIRNAVQTINSTDNSGAGDIALVYAYMKMLDPTSVVREGEFATAQNSGSAPEFVIAQYNKALNGQSLTDSIRNGFRKQAGELYKNAAKSEQVVREGVKRVAENNGFNLGNIFYEEASPSAPKRKAGAQGLAYFDENGDSVTFKDQATLDAFMKKWGLK